MESNEHVSKRRKKEDVPCEASDMSISLSVHSLDGHAMEFTVPAGSAVRQLKDRIAESVGVPPVMQGLLFGDCELDGSATFSESGVKAVDVITRVLVPLGDAVWSTDLGAFCALFRTGKVVAWGSADHGGHLDPEVKTQLEEMGLASK